MPFEHTRRALSAMKLRSTGRLLLLGCVAFLGWSTWLVVGRVSIFVKSTSARLEVYPAPMPVNAPVEGVVTACNIALGAAVTRGDTLLALDAHSFELQADEARATLGADEASVEALRAQLSVEQAARDAMVSVVEKTRRAGEIRVAVNQAASELKQQENDMMTRLSNAELASKMDSIREMSEAQAQRLQIKVSSVQAALDTSTARMTLQDRIIRVSTLTTQVIGAEKAVEIERAKLNILEYEVERRTVRALEDGTITDAVACSPGMTVTAATRLATVLPRGEVRVVAFFEPRAAVGRVKPDQTAIIRVENFPWTEFGTLKATVREVGSEPRDGTVRIEMAVSSLSSDIPAIHGLTATAEVETERLAPYKLVLRMAGQMAESTGAASVATRAVPE